MPVKRSYSSVARNHPVASRLPDGPEKRQDTGIHRPNRRIPGSGLDRSRNRHTACPPPRRAAPSGGDGIRYSDIQYTTAGRAGIKSTLSAISLFGPRFPRSDGSPTRWPRSPARGSATAGTGAESIVGRAAPASSSGQMEECIGTVVPWYGAVLAVAQLPAFCRFLRNRSIGYTASCDSEWPCVRQPWLEARRVTGCSDAKGPVLIEAYRAWVSASEEAADRRLAGLTRFQIAR